MTSPTSQLERIANALEHLVMPSLIHSSGQCEICAQKKKPAKKMPRSLVPTPAQLAKKEQEIRVQQMLHGPEEPIHDMFRYRELNKNNT